ncbi:hypothetical protein RDABS01_027666 [Bienertia sinuspersici]
MSITSVFLGTKTATAHFNLPTITHIACSPTGRRNLVTTSGKGLVLKPIFVTRNTRKCIIKERRKTDIGPILAVNSESSSEILSLSEVIKNFYRCINTEDKKGLEDLISSNCCVQDMTFPYIIQGKKEVMSLFIQLSESMGESVQFKLGTICEGDDLTASVMWHLEWKNDRVPFSRGCSVFQCSIEGDKLEIRNIQIITESPIKPGALAMALLKMVRSAFDEFPKAADWFLKRPHTILKAMLKIYNLFLAPIVNPILTFYITLWKLTTRVLGYAISFLHIIARFFTKDSSNDNDNDTSKLESDHDSTSLL